MTRKETADTQAENKIRVSYGITNIHFHYMQNHKRGFFRMLHIECKATKYIVQVRDEYFSSHAE